MLNESEAVTETKNEVVPAPPPSKKKQQQKPTDDQQQRYRGVYKCGKRFKAQLQSGGTQYYLGTFDTDEEAAKAYDKKAREEKGMKSLTNFDDNGKLRSLNPLGNADDTTATEETKLPPSTQPTSSSSSSSSSKTNKRAKISTENGTTGSTDSTAAGVLASLSASAFSNNGSLVETTTSNKTDIEAEMEATNNTQIRLLWDRFCQMSQRVMLAKAALDKLCKLQIVADGDDDDKDAAAVRRIQQEELISKLRTEIDHLSSNKQHVEDAISRSVSQTMLMQLKASSSSSSSTNNLLISLPATGRCGIPMIEAENGV